jgi:hypothetical protein
MAESSSRTLVCSVLCVELAGYAQLAGAEQLRRKRLLGARLAQEVTQISRAERAARDIETGMIAAFLADPEAALVAAIGLQEIASELPMRLGLALGTVHVVADLGGQVAIVGDAVNDAQRIAGEAAPGQLLVSGSFRDSVSRLSAEHAAVFRPVGRGELAEVRVGAAEPAPAPGRAAPGQASVFDAGPHLMISGYERAAVQKALDELSGKGARVLSPITHVGDKWMASCEHPAVRLSECKVEKLGLTSIVTGPTRQAVQTKVEELVELGARLTGEIEEDGGVWTAVCDSGGAGG